MRREVIGDATLYLGDCRDVLPTIGRVDAVVTDPPYGIARVWKGGFGRGWGKAWACTQERNQWDDEAPQEIVAALVNMNVPTVIWGGNYFNLPPSRGWLVWNKPERNFSLSEAELAWTNVDMCVRVIDAPRSEFGREHPTQKPVLVMVNSIVKAAANARTILDPFVGSGTTGVASARLGRSFIGIEREPRYFDIACRRIEEAQRQRDMFIHAAPPEDPAEERLRDLFAEPTE